MNESGLAGHPGRRAFAPAVAACAFAFAMIIATCSDFTKHRFVFTLIPISVAIAGFAILISVHHNKHVEYAGLFLVAMGAYSAMPVIVCWFNMNLGGHHRRAVGTARRDTNSFLIKSSRF